MDITIKIGNWA